MSPQELQAALEAIIYASDEPVSMVQLANATEADKTEIRPALDALVAKFQSEEAGIEIRKVAGGWKMYTKPQHHEVVRKFIKALRPPVRLTMPALETLAVIAYKQPVTGPEINDIRGVNCGGVLKTLLEKRLISTAGRKEVMGRPILYRTSKDFLMRFGLSDLEELPSLKEFEALAQAALGSDDGIAPLEPAERAAMEGIAEEETEAGFAAEESGDATEARAAESNGAATDGITDDIEEESMANREVKGRQDQGRQDQGIVPPDKAANTEPSADNMDSESMRSEVNVEQAEKFEDREKSNAAKAGAGEKREK
jgi:segregation and condensation protein B